MNENVKLLITLVNSVEDNSKLKKDENIQRKKIKS